MSHTDIYLYSQHFAKIKKEVNPVGAATTTPAAASPSTPNAPRTPSKSVGSSNAGTPTKPSARKRKADEASTTTAAAAQATPTKRGKTANAKGRSGLSVEITQKKPAPAKKVESSDETDEDSSEPDDAE